MAVDRSAGVGDPHLLSTAPHAYSPAGGSLPRLAAGLSPDYLLHHGICPSSYTEDGALRVLVSADADVRTALEDLTLAYGTRVEPQRVDAAEVQRTIERIVASPTSNPDEALGSDDDDSLLSDLRDLASQPPVVRYVNFLVREAYESGASDVHLEAWRNGLTSRMRLDGVLTNGPQPPSGLHYAVVSRIKLLAELDIAERRRPQDGRIRVRLEERELDVRVSTVPTMFGESVVLRLLDRGGQPVNLEDLGMPRETLGRVAHLTEKTHGLVLITGPTGSGKTTTLYAALQRRDVMGEKIIAVEDPVEYQLRGVTQVPVHRQAGVTFATALRSILRQDPDVVMIGEMRDAETAEIGVQAAMTGHLVFSSLHTNDAVAAIPRLVDLGVPEYLIAATLEGVLAQRLVRRTCDACRTDCEPPPEQMARLATSSGASSRLTRGSGCPACRGTGYRGRVGIFELLVATDEIRDAIAARAPRSALRTIAGQQGMLTLQEDGWRKVLDGVTTPEEVLRAVQD